MDSAKCGYCSLPATTTLPLNRQPDNSLKHDTCVNVSATASRLSEIQSRTRFQREPFAGQTVSSGFCTLCGNAGSTFLPLIQTEKNGLRHRSTCNIAATYTDIRHKASS